MHGDKHYGQLQSLPDPEVVVFFIRAPNTRKICCAGILGKLRRKERSKKKRSKQEKGDIQEEDDAIIHAELTCCPVSAGNFPRIMIVMGQGYIYFIFTD